MHRIVRVFANERVIQFSSEILDTGIFILKWLMQFDRYHGDNGIN